MSKIIGWYVNYEFTILGSLDILLTILMGYFWSPMWFWLLLFEIPIFIAMYKERL